jgi:lipopolysaccharide export system protein LptC
MIRRPRLTTLAPLVLVGALAALTFWLDRLGQGTDRDIIGPSRHDPDFIVDRLTAVSLNAAGIASYTLSAARMTHYPDDDSTLLTDPTFVSYGSAKAPVTITSSEGVISSKGDHVYFQDNVRVTRASYENSSELVLRTSFLHVVPEKHIALTDRSVTITDATTVVTAEGFELNSETGVIKLMSKVRGTYDPAKEPSPKPR